MKEVLQEKGLDTKEYSGVKDIFFVLNFVEKNRDSKS